MNILEQVYSRVHPLGQWIEMVDQEKQLSYVTDEDPESYRSFLASTLVCQRDKEVPQPVLHTSPSFHQREVIFRVIQKLRKKEPEKNVLSFGFGTMSDDCNALISDVPNIEYRYPDSNLNRLQSGSWRRLYLRTGDSLLEYLLEHTSLFMVSPPSSYIQMTGQPLYDLIQTGMFFTSDKRKSFRNIYGTNTAEIGADNCDSQKSAVLLSKKLECQLKRNFSVKLEKEQKRKKKKYDLKELKERAKIYREKMEGNQEDISCESVVKSDEYVEEENQFSKRKREQDDEGIDLELSGPPSKILRTEKLRQPQNMIASVQEDQMNRKRKRRRKGKHIMTDTNKEFKPYNHFLPFPRSSVFYAKNLRDQLPTQYILNKVQSTEEGAGILYRKIFEASIVSDKTLRFKLCPPVTEAKSEGHLGQPDEIAKAQKEENIEAGVIYIPYIPQLQCVLQELILNHRKCCYKFLLNCYCQHTCTRSKSRKIVKDASLSRTQYFYRKFSQRTVGTSNFPSVLDCRRKGSLTTSQLLESFTSRQQVFLFIRSILKKVVPDSLIGPENMRIVLKNVRRLLCMGKFDKFGLGEIMKYLKTKKISWLRGIGPQHLKLHYLALIIHWLISFVFVLIKSFFYVTESTRYRNRIFYYRKQVWQMLYHRGWKDLKTRGIFKMISKEKALNAIQQGKALGWASLRFLPKKTSLRPIINLGLHPPECCKSILPINKQLLNLLHILTYLKNQNPDCVGYAKFGMDEIYTTWKDYVKHRDQSQDRRPLYFIKTDISNCYDDIDHDRLYTVVLKLFENYEEESEFIIQRYVSLVKSAGHIRKKFHRQVCCLDGYDPNFARFIKTQTEKKDYKNLVLINQVMNYHEKVKDLLSKFRAHLFCNIVKVGKLWYVQQKGISQGSVISTLLCNLYYGDLERSLMKVEDGEVMMRVVDDALFVTPDKQRALEYLHKVIQGNEQYNFSTNANKMLISFEYSHPQYGEVPQHQSEWFPWCGLLFNTKTLEVANDYTRYTGLAIRDTMSINLVKSPTQSMKSNLVLFLRAKCHGLFVDQEINSMEVVLCNSHKLLLMLSYKFHCYAKELPYKSRVDDRPSHFIDMILEFGCFFYHHVCNVLSKKGRDRKLFIFSREFCQWLCLKTFQVTFTHRHTFYHKTLKLMRQMITMMQKKISKDENEKLSRVIHCCTWNIPTEFTEILT